MARAKAADKPEEVVDPALSPEENVEPATADESSDEKPKAAKAKKQDPAKKPSLKVGDKVKYPHKESDGGYRVTNVLDVDDDYVTIRGIDGGARQVAISLVEKA